MIKYLNVLRIWKIGNRICFATCCIGGTVYCALKTKPTNLPHDTRFFADRTEIPRTTWMGIGFISGAIIGSIISPSWPITLPTISYLSIKNSKKNDCRSIKRDNILLTYFI